MQNSRRQLFLSAGFLFATSAGATLLKPTPRVSNEIDVESAIPKSFAGWEVDPSIVPLKPTPDAQAKLDQIYDQILGRTYRRQTGERIMLTIAYGSQQTDKLKAHRQEVCYAAQGFRISGLSKDKVDVANAQVPVTRFMATLGQRQEPVSYWFTMGNHVVGSRFDRLITQIKHGFLGEIPDGLLVRISSISRDLPAAYRAHDEFANALVDNVAVQHQQRLIGSVA
jgi:EpsI family protein